MTNHTELLNHLATTHQLGSYLEIGVQNPANNFDKIECEYKRGIDPNVIGFKNIYDITSNKFFEGCRLYWDLVFIDGLHTAEQVKKDFENALNRLTDYGFIVIHDCLPANEPGTRVPRETKVWWGDVYKFIFKLPGYAGINFCTYDFDHGCCVVWKDASKAAEPIPLDVDFNFYLSNKELMRLVE